MKKFDDSPFSVIVFDEIYLNNLTILRRIREYILKNPNKIILATGDTDQNKTVNILRGREYLSIILCIVGIF